ncbi:hypothetical protein BHM03_00024628 [Ensete ventricosum]|nr:hypothetical protein BHM03_00024628 [Ensete ventricosum]
MVELQLDLSLHRLYMMPQEAMHTYAAFKGSSYNAPRVAAYNAAGGSSYDGPRGTALVMRPLWLLDMMVIMGNAAAPYGLTNAPSYGAAAAAAASPLYGFNTSSNIWIWADSTCLLINTRSTIWIEAPCDGNTIHR